MACEPRSARLGGIAAVLQMRDHGRYECGERHLEQRQGAGPTEMPRPGAPTMDERRTPSHGLGGRGMVAARNLWELKDHRLVGFPGEPGSSPTEVRWACGGHGRREQDSEPDGRGSRAVGCGSESSWRGVRMRRLTRGPIRPLVAWARDIGGSWHDVAQPSGSPPARG